MPEQGFLGSWLTLLDDLKIVESDIFAYGDETAFEFAGVAPRWPICAPFRSPEARGGGLLALHGLHFDLGSGELLGLEQETGHFVAWASLAP